MPCGVVRVVPVPQTWLHVSTEGFGGWEGRGPGQLDGLGGSQWRLGAQPLSCPDITQPRSPVRGDGTPGTKEGSPGPFHSALGSSTSLWHRANVHEARGDIYPACQAASLLPMASSWSGRVQTRRSRRAAYGQRSARAPDRGSADCPRPLTSVVKRRVAAR